jgi:cytochrome c biogenesis protein CcdA
MVSRALASLHPCVLQALPMLISALGAVRYHALRGHARPQSLTATLPPRT